MTKTEASCLPCKGTETRDWISYINLQPPGPFDFHVHGEVYVPNPGVEPILTPRSPQGINPRVLLLDLILVQKPGLWPTLMVWKPARYHKVCRAKMYDSVQIFCDDEIIADIPVEEYH